MSRPLFLLFVTTPKLIQTDRLNLEAFLEDALAKLKAGEGLLGVNGAIMPLLQAFLDEALWTEVKQQIVEARNRIGRTAAARRS